MKKSLMTNSFYNIIRTFVTLVFPLIIFMYASRILGPDGIGKVEFGKNISGYYVLLASLGINNYGIREGARLRDDRKKFSKFVHEIIIINICSTLISLSLFFAMAFFVNSLESYKHILIVFSITILMTPMGIEWAYGALEEYKYISLRTAFFQILALIILLIFVKGSDDIIWYAVVLIVSSVGSNIMNLIHIWKYVDLKVVSPYQIKKHLPSIFILFALAVSNTIYSYVDTTMIGFIVGDREVGLYTAALKVNRIVVNVLGAVGAVVMPRLSYLWKSGNKEEFVRIINIVINILLMVSIPSCIGIMSLSRPLLAVFCGESYIDASFAMQVLSLIIIILSSSTFFNMHILVPVNKELSTMKAISFGLVTNIVFNAFLIPIYGRNGAAVGTVIGEGVVLIVGLYYANRIVRVLKMLKNIWQYIIASLPIAFICYFSKMVFNEYILQIVFSVLFSAIIYISGIIVLKNETIYILIRMIKSKYNKRR